MSLDSVAALANDCLRRRVHPPRVNSVGYLCPLLPMIVSSTQNEATVQIERLKLSGQFESKVILSVSIAFP